MDEETLKLIVLGLITSGFTIILTKAFEFLKQKSEHHLFLKKTFFERKLEIAEATVEYLNEKADKFDHIGTILSKIDFIKNEDGKVNMKDRTGYSMDWIFDMYIDFDNVQDLFQIEIPPKAYLYFNLNKIKNPRKEFDKKNTELINDFKKLEEPIAKFQKLAESIDLEDFEKLSEEEKTEKAVKLIVPLLRIQVNLKKWAKLLFETKDDLQTLSLRIEKEFYKYL